MSELSYQKSAGATVLQGLEAAGKHLRDGWMGPDGRRMHVAVLDDDYFVCETLTAVLENAGFDVTVFNTAEEAVDRIHSDRFFAMIADYRLQDGTSEIFLLEAVRLSQSGNTSLAQKIILLTGAIDLSGEGASVGVQGMLHRCEVELRVKPYSPSKLMLELQKKAQEIGGQKLA